MNPRPSLFLLALAACTAPGLDTYETCGDGVINSAAEVCDGADLDGLTCQSYGYARGQLLCDPSCGQVDLSQCEGDGSPSEPVCGDGVLDEGEDCDTVVAEGQTCRDLGYDVGNLGCNPDCTFDDSRCLDDCDDSDADGWADPDCGGDDCAPDDANVHPGAPEQCNQEDDDCDGSVDEDVVNTTWYRDSDGDGWGDDGQRREGCVAPAGYVSRSGDCDDGDASVNPSAAEECDGLDQNCNGRVDEDVRTSTWYRDSDGDSYGDPSRTLEDCAQPSGYVSDSSDCDDSDRSVYPRASETCDSVDEDCDGGVDEGVATSTWYEDADGDRYGDASSALRECAQPSGYVSDDSDCDDNDRSVNPGASESCDHTDDDCDSYVDEDLANDQTVTRDFCSGSERDILTVTSIRVNASGDNPVITATFEKCDGTAFSSTKSCHVRVGSWWGSYSSSLVRTSFSWTSGSASETVSWDAWPSGSDFEADSCSSYKEFYLVCRESGGDWNHWRTENPIVIYKD